MSYHILLISLFLQSCPKAPVKSKLLLENSPAVEVRNPKMIPKPPLDTEVKDVFEDKSDLLVQQGPSTLVGKTEWDNLLTSIHYLWKKRNPNRKQTKAFISYAWEDVSTEQGKIDNSKLQRYLVSLRDDLQKAGVSVFLDISDMHGDMKKRMEDNLKASDVIITINTPRFKERAEADTNLGFEYRLTLDKAKDIPYGIFPLLYLGDFNTSLPDTLKKYLVRDCRNIEKYKDILIAKQGPLGIIPAIYGINCEDKEYQSLVHNWRVQSISKLPPLSPHFAGREKLLVAIEKSLEEKGSTTHQQQVISGMGGVGKSLLALAYAYKYSDKYKIKRWLNVEGSNIKLEFEQLASELGIDAKGMDDKDLASSVYKRIGSIDTFLLIFDNADDHKSIEAYLPKDLNVGQHILITSRNQHWNYSIVLDCFSQKEAVEYITKKLVGVSRKDAELLANALGYLPLALGHAVNYIKETSISIKSYLNLYQAKDIELLQTDGHSLSGDDYPHNVLTTWSLSMEKLQQKSPAAATMLEICGYLASDNIPVELFVDESLLKDKVVVNEALRALKNYSLIQFSNLADHIHVHRLVQSVTRRKYHSKTSKEEREALLIQMAKAVEKYCPEDKLNEEDFNKARVLLPHMHSIIDNLKPYAIVNLGEQNRIAIAQGNLLKATACSLYELGDYKGSKELYQQALVVNKKHYGKDHPIVARTLESLGNAFYSLGDYGGAKKLYQQALVINEKHYGKNHVVVVRTLENLGNVLLSLGEYRGAKKLYQQALVINEKHYGKNHPVVAGTLENLGNVLLSLGDYGGAKKLHQQALVVNEKHYGKDHPIVARALENLGNTLRNLRDNSGAKELYQQALVINERHYGKDHPVVVGTQGNLGNILLALGDYKGSKELYQQALVVNEKYYGKNHPAVARMLENLGNVFLSLEDYIKANELYQQALVVNEKYYGKNHPVVARNLYNLSLLYEKAKDLSHVLEAIQVACRIAQANGLNNIFIYENRLRKIEQLEVSSSKEI